MTDRRTKQNGRAAYQAARQAAIRGVSAAQNVDRILAEEEVPEAEMDAAWDKWETSTLVLIKTPAITAEGIALKLSTTKNWAECTQDDDDNAGLADGLRHWRASGMYMSAARDRAALKHAAEQAPVAA